MASEGQGGGPSCWKELKHNRVHLRVEVNCPSPERGVHRVQTLKCRALWPKHRKALSLLPAGPGVFSPVPPYLPCPPACLPTPWAL